MANLYNILSPVTFWKNINPQLTRIQERTTNLYVNFSYRSRTLTEVLRKYTTTYYYNNALSYATRTLAQLITLLTNKKIQIHGHYETINSESAETYTLPNLINLVGATHNEHLNIHFVHIPKGKTYARKILDDSNLPDRLKNIETFCIENINHFIRIYRGFGMTNSTDITIITDHITDKMFETLLVMLPHLFNLLPAKVSESEEKSPLLTETDVDYNNKVIQLNHIFAQLYNIHTNGIDDSSVTTKLEEIRQLINTYTALFDFNNNSIKLFAEKLATAKNNLTTRHFTDELNNSIDLIRRLETELTQAYNKKDTAQRALNAHKTLNADDVQPFIDTINNTKAIEILEADQEEIILRITAPLQYFTESDFEAYENNPNSTYRRTFDEEPVKKQILHKIFVTREYKLLAQGVIRLKINSNTYSNSILYLEALRDSNRNRYTQFPNPHLYHHNCWSKAQSEIQKNISEGNFELVVMQMVAAVQSINIAENASFVNGLLYDLRNSDFKDMLTIIDKENNRYTYKQIIKHETELIKTKEIEAAIETLAQAPKDEYTQVVLSEMHLDETIEDDDEDTEYGEEEYEEEE